MNIAMTKKELASVAGYTYRRLHDIDTSLPSNQKLFVLSDTEEKKYDLAIFVQRWVAYNSQISEAEDDELSTIKARHEVVKMEKTKIEVSKLKGEYVSISALAPLWSQIAATVADRLNNLANKLAPSLVMIADADIIEQAIEREVRDALSALNSMPVPETETAEEKEETVEE
mgnify:CR=1 FL=1